MSVFIPKQYKKEQITIRISAEKLTHIDQLAARINVSRSDFINQCIDFAMENMSELPQVAAPSGGAFSPP